MTEDNHITLNSHEVIISSAPPILPPQEIALNIDGHWLMKLNTQGIHFNRECFTEFKADDFAREVMRIFEENFDVKFEKRNPTEPKAT